MPTYDYICTKCKHVFEKFHSINFEGEVECPICGAKAERKIGSGLGIIFKGSGFYITDYKNKSTNSNSTKSNSNSSQNSTPSK